MRCLLATHYRQDNIQLLCAKLRECAPTAYQYIIPHRKNVDVDALIKSFVRNSILPISLYDREMRLLEMSKPWKEMYQLTEDNIGKRHYQMFQELPTHWIAAHQAALNGRVLEHMEEPYQLANGAAGWHRWQCLPWHDHDGDINGIIISAEDITSKKDREIQLNKVLARFELIQQAAKIGMWDWDIINRDITFNAEYYEILGWDKYRNISNKDFYDLIHPDDLAGVKAEMNSALGGGAHYRAEFRIYRHNDHKLRWVKDKGMIEFDEDGVPLRGYGAIIDVTEQKLLSHEQLRAAGENYHNMINAMLEGIWSVDRNGVTTYVNSATTKMLGYTEEELIGKSMFSFSDAEWNKLSFGKFSDRKNGASERYKLQLRKKDGSGLWCLVSANPVFEDGQFIGTVAVLIDFSEQMASEAAKDKRIEELERILANVG